MRFVRDFWSNREFIEGGQEYQNSAESMRAVNQNFHFWCPQADPQYGVVAIENGRGAWSLQARHWTNKGWSVTEIEFKNFRPIWREVGSAARQNGI
jgi:hypothetical protein